MAANTARNIFCSNPVEYVVYPNEGHGFTHRENRVDSMSRAVAFFLKQMGTRR